MILKSKNRSLSEGERIALIKQAEKIETANYNQRVAQAKNLQQLDFQEIANSNNLTQQELSNLKTRGVAYANYLLYKGKINDSDRDKVIKNEISQISIQEESTKRLEKAQNQKDALKQIEIILINMYSKP